jgi:hypothetical protein
MTSQTWGICGKAAGFALFGTCYRGYHCHLGAHLRPSEQGGDRPTREAVARFAPCRNCRCARSQIGTGRHSNNTAIIQKNRFAALTGRTRPADRMGYYRALFRLQRGESAAVTYFVMKLQVCCFTLIGRAPASGESRNDVGTRIASALRSCTSQVAPSSTRNWISASRPYPKESVTRLLKSMIMVLPVRETRRAHLRTVKSRFSTLCVSPHFQSSAGRSK